MLFTEIAEKLFPMLAVLLIGFAAAKLGALDEKSGKLMSTLVLDITMPCSILYSVFAGERPLSKLQVLWLTLTACAVIALLLCFCALSEQVFSIKSEKRGVTRYMVIFWSAMIGYPMVRTLFGPEAVFYAAVFCTVFMVLSYTYGVKLTGGGGERRSVKDILLTPVVLCALIGYGGYLLEIELPKIVLDTLALGDGATSPLSMLVVGCALARMPRREMKDSVGVYVILALRMTLFPLLCYYAMSKLGMPELMSKVTALCLAAPPAPSTAVMCARYGGDESLAVSGVFVSTIFFFLSLPILLLVIG